MPSKNRYSTPPDGTADAVAFAESIALPRIDEAAAVARPDTIGTTYLEREFEALREAQKPSWDSDGMEASRAASVLAESRKAQAFAAAQVLDLHQKVLEQAQAAMLAAEEALRPFTRRDPHTKHWYVARWSTLLVGDVAGISGAAILMGEIPALAVAQAVAAGMAAVTAGIVGSDVRERQMAALRRRPSDELPPALAPYAQLFAAPDAASQVMRPVIGVAVAVACLIAVGIFGLRTSIEGPLSGLVFGSLAGAIAAASFLNSWASSDAVSDLLDTYRHLWTRELKRHALLASAPPISDYAEAAESARSIIAEHEFRGIAARHAFDALRYGTLRRNPGVVGHGEAPDAIGRSTKVAGK